MKERTVQLKFRVTEKEKQRIINNTKKCGLSISEYLRKRALGYSPRALLSEGFYEFSEKLGILCDKFEAIGNATLYEKTLSLIDEIQLKLLSTEKDSLSESSQSLLCGEKEHTRNGKPFDAGGKSDEWSVM